MLWMLQNAVLEKADATQAEVDEAYSVLKAAADGLQEVQTPGGDDEDIVVKQQLQNLYDTVKDLSAAAYTTESWQAFQTARDAAQAVLSDPEATQGRCFRSVPCSVQRMAESEVCTAGRF